MNKAIVVLLLALVFVTWQLIRCKSTCVTGGLNPLCMLKRLPPVLYECKNKPEKESK